MSKKFGFSIVAGKMGRRGLRKSGIKKIWNRDKKIKSFSTV